MAWKTGSRSLGELPMMHKTITLGALLPLLTITLVTRDLRIAVTVAAVVVALALTGWSSARFGYGRTAPASRLRNVAGGAFAMGVTYLIGSLLGTTVG